MEFLRGKIQIGKQTFCVTSAEQWSAVLNGKKTKNEKSFELFPFQKLQECRKLLSHPGVNYLAIITIEQFTSKSTILALAIIYYPYTCKPAS